MFFIKESVLIHFARNKVTLLKKWAVGAAKALEHQGSKMKSGKQLSVK